MAPPTLALQRTLVGVRVGPVSWAVVSTRMLILLALLCGLALIGAFTVQVLIAT